VPCDFFTDTSGDGETWADERIIIILGAHSGGGGGGGYSLSRVIGCWKRTFDLGQ